MSPDDDFKLSPDLELQRIITLQEAEKISSLSVRFLEAAPLRQDHRDEPAPSWRAAARRTDAQAALNENAAPVRAALAFLGVAGRGARPLKPPAPLGSSPSTSTTG